MATKKISELPLITALSGSQEETLIPVVVGGLNGTTNRITAENFSKFVNAYNATTSSNTFIGAQIINGNLTVTGNQVISGRLTVKELVAQYETASIIFSSGSNKFGDELTDTQEFTGSVEITGSIISNGNLILNGASLNNSFVRIHQATGSLQNFTSSQADRNLNLSIVTGSINDFTSSQLIVNTGLASVTASLNNFSGSTNAFTGAIEKTTASIHLATASLNYFYSFSSSQLVVNTGLASVTASLNNFSGSTNAFTGGIEKTTASIHLATASLNYFYQSTSSLNAFTASQDDRNYIISQFTSSTDAHIVGISAFTSSQLAVNLGNSIYTASVDSHIVGISTYTSSVRDTLARVHQSTASLQNFTSSQDSRNFTLSQVTSSFNYFYQATRSLELHSGSMVGVTNGLMAYTASNNSLNTGLRGEVDGIEAYTASLKAAISVSGTNVQIIGDLNVNKLNVQYISSSVLVTSGSNTFGDQSTDKHEFTGSVYLQNALIIGTEVLGNAGLNSFTASTNNSIVGVSQFTSSQLAVNLQNSIVTSSFRIELNSIEAYTASLKAASIVSSSTQVENYNKFAVTASSNTFYGNQYITGALSISDVSSMLQIVGNGFGQASLISPNGALIFTAGYGGVQINGANPDLTVNGNITGGNVTGNIIATNNVVSSSTQVQNYDVFALNSNIYTSTGSLIGITNGLMALTASMKAEAIVSSSTQIQNYFTFAKTGSVNTFYGNQIITGGLDVRDGVTGSFKGNLNGTATYAGTVSMGNSSTNQNYAVVFTTAGSNGYLSQYTDAFGGMLYNPSTNKLTHSGSIVTTEGITGSLLATNGIVSSSQQITNYYKFAETASANTFYGTQTITGSLNVGVGTSDNTVGDLFVDTANKTVYIGRQSSTSGDNTIFAVRNRLNTVNAFYVDPGGVGAVQMTGSLEVTRGVKLGTATGNVEVIGNLVMSTAGNGIDFSANSNAAGMTSELLNDYEEGTWSPTIRGSGTAGTYELATDYTTYTKIGRQVTLNGQIKFGTSVTGGGTGYLQITGAPFTKAANTVATGAVRLVNINFTGDFVTMNFASLAAGTTLFLAETVDNSTPIDLPISAAVANAEFAFTITYFV